MEASTFKPEEKRIAGAMNILIDKWGLVKTNRFLSPLKTGRVELVKRYQPRQSKLKKDKLFERFLKNDRE